MTLINCFLYYRAAHYSLFPLSLYDPLNPYHCVPLSPYVPFISGVPTSSPTYNPTQSPTISLSPTSNIRSGATSDGRPKNIIIDYLGLLLLSVPITVAAYLF